MIRDPNAFLDDYGGFKEASALTNGGGMFLGALLAPFRGSTLAGKLLYSQSNKEIISDMLGSGWKFPRQARGRVNTFDASVGRDYFDVLESRHFGIAGFDEERALMPQLRREKKIIQEALSAGKARPRALNNSLRNLGFAFLTSQLASMVMHATTPGVSRVAIEKDEKAIANEMFIDSGRAYTQRQRALQAIYDSQMSTRNVLGNEAQFLHM